MRSYQLGWFRSLQSSPTASVCAQELRVRKLLLDWTHSDTSKGFHVHDSFVSAHKPSDVEALVKNFTAPALARALRDREHTLSRVSSLLSQGKVDEAKVLASPFSKQPARSRISKLPCLRQNGGLFQKVVLDKLKHRLGKLPREVTSRASKRACVVLPLCTKNNEAHLLFTQRSFKLRKHPGEFCFPGGLVDTQSDESVIDSGLREMEEEIGVKRCNVDVLGVLRMDWTEVKAMTGIAVTPILCNLGEIENVSFNVNEMEVQKLKTVSLESLLDKKLWNKTFNFSDKDGEDIYGLTGYITFHFLKLLPSVIFQRSLTSADFSLN